MTPTTMPMTIDPASSQMAALHTRDVAGSKPAAPIPEPSQTRGFLVSGGVPRDPL
jgi:hypothetical protein